MWYRRIFCLVTSVLLIAGCVRRDLVDPDESALLRIRVNTVAVSNVTADIYNEKIPRPNLSSDVLRVLFYDQSGERMLSEGFITEKSIDENGNDVISGSVYLSPGNYRIMAYNFDTPTTQVRNYQSWYGATAYTSTISDALRAQIVSRADWSEHIYYEPDHLIVARETNRTIVPHHGDLVIEMDASSIIDTYYVQIRVKNLEYASTANAVLTGLSSSNNIGDNIRNEEESSAIFIELHKSIDENITDGNQDVLCAVFNTFGKIDDMPSNMHITFNAVSREGEIVEKEIDMTPIFATEDARVRHWLLINEVWELPKPTTPPSTGGGFNPEVDDWDDEEENIPIE